MKSHMLDMTPFEETIFLDIDTVVLQPLDTIFDILSHGSLAAAYDSGSSMKRWNISFPNVPEFNTGVIGFVKQHRPIFEAWKRLCGEDVYKFGNDQPYFTLSCLENGRWPFVLDERFNFRYYNNPRPELVNGPIHVWHTPVAVPQNMPSGHGLFMVNNEQ